MRRAETALHDDTLEDDIAYLCAHFTFLGDIEIVGSLDETLTWNVVLILDIQERFDAIHIVAESWFETSTCLRQ